MLAIKLRFPGGRYHATPWGRHVNEAEVEWPPSPWRIVRALIATWHRKLDHEVFPRPLLEQLVKKLSSAAPDYCLPSATRAHTRHYMPVRDGKRDKPVLIFDAFVKVARDATLIVAWSQVELERGEEQLLDAALAAFGFLGRSESWIEAARTSAWDGNANCTSGELSLDLATGEMREPVQLLLPREAEEYRKWRGEMMGDLASREIKPKSRRLQLESTLPESLLEALSIDSGDLRQAGWSQPPAGRFVTYQRPYACFAPARRSTIELRKAEQVTTIRLALFGKPLPMIEDSIRLGELLRAALNSRCEHALGYVPPAVSGHGLGSGNRHGHAFYLAEDADGDGHIDHLVIHSDLGLGEVLPVFESFTKLYDGDGGDWQLMVEGFGSRADFASNGLLGTSRHWISVTPYLHPWHAKKNFGYAEQIRRECRVRGLPEPLVELRTTIVNARGREYRPLHFHRFRSKQGLTQPDTAGTFLELTFPDEVTGPVALGFGNHFGLGLFTSVDESSTNNDVGDEESVSA